MHDGVSVWLTPSLQGAPAAESSSVRLEAQEERNQGLADALLGVREPGALAKCGPVAESSITHRSLGTYELQHLADRHAGGEAVRVHDEVRAEAALAEGQVLLRHNGAHHALLPVPAAELVAHLGPPSMPRQRLHSIRHIGRRSDSAGALIVADVPSWGSLCLYGC